jgi:glycine/D-amino acid oxidase-like deaminating enzyme/nitrite reductase/ring-hydroxylating ferredoxin subunit
VKVRKSKPLWQDVRLPRFPTLRRSGEFDVVVIGGGVTGLSAALFLKQAGKRVCLLERDRLGHGDTIHTTAHLTCDTDARLTQLVKTFGADQAALAWYGGACALDLIEQIVTENRIECEFRRTPGFLTAALDGTRDETGDLQHEATVARKLGFDVDFVPCVPVVDKPGIRIRDQGKFHPMAYLAGLANLVQGDGCSIHESTTVTDVESAPLAVLANGFKIACDYVVIATHVPLTGKNGLVKASLLQSKLTSYSTYVVSGRLPAVQVPDLSLWDTGNPYYYLRVDAGNDFDRIIFGGNDHKTGQETDTENCYDRLAQTLSRVLPNAKLDHRWSGQVVATNDGLPLIGETTDRQFVATGFNGNGITFGTLAGMMARDAVLKKENPWQGLFSVGRTKILGGGWEYVKQNMDFPYYFLADHMRRLKHATARAIKRGEGQILKIDGQRVACSRDARGRLLKVSAVCTHLGCLVRWNDAEKTWDCPCHGSRFLPEGEVLAGPAETPLEPLAPSKRKQKIKPAADA